MEETIKEILWPTSFMMEHDRIRISKEITDHVFKFIEWLSSKGFDHTRGKYYSDTDKGYVEFTLEELYKFWRNNTEQK
jgi:hypothetical protein